MMCQIIVDWKDFSQVEDTKKRKETLSRIFEFISNENESHIFYGDKS